MDELKEMMRQIMRDMKQNTDELKDEIKEIKQEMRKKEEKWEREKTQLVQRVVEFLKQELQIQANIKEAYKINREKHYQMVRVELESFQNKIDIMKAKSKLKNTIYKRNYGTLRERREKMGMKLK
ncbi:hypothetical protein QE152_g26910 [Popillia japonica]|uniref:Uncharacterized protein n=1 Tax=Popillia japonica TaxID=7064 RepID=A0AAW1JXD0_POPJA